MPAEIRQLKGEAKAEVLRAISEGLLMDMGSLQSLVQKAQPRIGGQVNPHYDSTVPVVDVLVASVLGNCIKDGDMARFSLLINYVMGKPKPLGSSWHDDPPDEDGKPTAQTALKQIPSAMLIEMIRRTNAPTGFDTGG